MSEIDPDRHEDWCGAVGHGDCCNRECDCRLGKMWAEVDRLREIINRQKMREPEYQLLRKVRKLRHENQWLKNRLGRTKPADE